MKKIVTLLLVLVLMAPGVSFGGVQSYSDLLAAIRETRNASEARIEVMVAQEKVREAWETGKLIDEHVLQHQERADYGKQVLKQLAMDLNTSQTELSLMLQFARAYPNYSLGNKLSWSHYRALLSINDAEDRQALAEQAEKEKWNRDRLRAEIKAFKKKGGLAEANVAETLIPLTVGQPGTYKIMLAEEGPYQGELVLDIGFSNYLRLADVTQDLSPFTEGDRVLFSEDEVRILSKSRISDPKALLYTYKAWVKRILDGDTIEAVIGLGFGLTTTQTLRLRGIDCPELLSAEGKESKKFVEDLFKPGTQIFIKTMKSDKYDRYLADIFFTAQNGEDQYLNNLLLQEGLAVKVRD